MFADLVGVDVARVATGSTVSGLLGQVASALPDGARVLAPDVEFTSALFPLFMTVEPSLLDQIVPLAAGWYAGEDPHASYFGPPLRLAASVRRLDVSPAWHCWVGTLPALELVRDIGVAVIHAHDLKLANRFRAGLGLPPGDSAIVFCDQPGAADKLARAGIMAAVRGGRLRTSWHVYNTESDVDATLAALRD